MGRGSRLREAGGARGTPSALDISGDLLVMNMRLMLGIMREEVTPAAAELAVWLSSACIGLWESTEHFALELHLFPQQSRRRHPNQ